MDNELDNQDYQDEEIEQTPFSILNVLKNEGEKESTIQDLINLAHFIHKEINNKTSSTKEEIVNLYNMVLELLGSFQQVTESCLTNNEMMSNLFELYQISDELRYYFALFNGDVKMKLCKLITSNDNKIINYFNNKDQINFESILFKSFINNQNQNQNQNKIIELFNYNRNEINNKLNSIIKDQGELESIKTQIQNELNKKEVSSASTTETTSNEMVDEKEVIEKSFFIIFQIFTSFLYNLQSLGEKLLLSLQDFSDSANEKKELYNTLIERDLVNLNSIIQLVKLMVNQKEQNQSQDDFISNLFNKIQYNNNLNNKDKSNSFANSIQSIILNYIQINNINEESILEFLNN